MHFVGFAKIADCVIHFSQVISWGNASKKSGMA